MDELEGGTDTHKLFLEQGTLEEKKQKELAEYIDAKNKEVITNISNLCIIANRENLSRACWTTNQTIKMLNKSKIQWQLCIARSD